MKCKNIRVWNGSKCSCGGCTACRINTTSQWKLRLLYELEDWPFATFLTLNYSNEYFDWLIDKGRFDEVNNLSPKEVTAYWKRVRRSLDYWFDDPRPMKHYTCGEYGERRGRAHYHAIVFGLDHLSDDDMDILKFAWNEKRKPVPRNEDFQWLRSRGKKCAYQPVTPDDIAYVTGYVQKKLTGQRGREYYHGRTLPFAQMSKGMGFVNAEKNKDVLAKGWTYLPGGTRVAVPRYYREKLGIEIDFKDDYELEKQEDAFFLEKFKEEQPELVKVLPPSKFSVHFEAFKNEYRGRLAEQSWQDFEQRQKLRGSSL